MTRAHRLVLAGRVQALLGRGMRPGKVAATLHISRERVQALRKLAVPPSRPDWSVPDDNLLALARSIRGEIEQAEGFRRTPI